MKKVFLRITVFTVTLLLLAIAADVGRPDPIEPPEENLELPYERTMPSNMTVFVRGERVGASVTFYRDAGDTVRISDGDRDVPIWPFPGSPVPHACLATIQELYGRVPCIRENVRQGSEKEWVDAHQEYLALQRTIRAEISHAYWDVLAEDLTDVDRALEAAEKALAPFLELLDPSRGYHQRVPPDLRLFWKGMSAGETVLLHTGRFTIRPPVPRNRIPDDKTVQARLSEFSWYLRKAQKGTSVLIVYSRRGMHALTDTLAEEAERQIERARGGFGREGPLFERELAEILARRGEGD